MVNETGSHENTAPALPSSGAGARSRFAWHGDRLARWSAIALGASLPISTALDNVLLVLIAAGWLASAGFNAKWSAMRATWTSRLVIAMVVLGAVGLTYTAVPTVEALRTFFKHLVLLLIPMLLTLAWTQRERDLAIKAFALAMLVVLALSYGIAAGIIPSSPTGLIKGPAANPYVFKLQISQNYLMAFAVFVYAGYAMVATRRVVRAGWALASVAAIINVGVMVQGRTGYLVLLVLALVVLGHWYGWRGVAAAVVGGAILVAGAYATSSTFRLRIDQVGTEWARWHAGEARAAGGVYDRLTFYSNTLRIVAAHPLVGVGTGGFPDAYRRTIAGSNQLATQNPHSQYLLTAAEQGVAGIVLLLGLFVAVWRDSRRQADPQDRLVLRAVLAAMAVSALVNSTLIDHVEMLFFVWGCGIALAGPRRER